MRSHLEVGPVAFEGEDVLAGPEDRLDALADGRQVRTLSGLVLAAGPHHAPVKVLGRPGDFSAGVSLVVKERLPAPAPAAGKEGKAHLLLISLGRGDLKGPRRPVTPSGR